MNNCACKAIKVPYICNLIKWANLLLIVFLFAHSKFCTNLGDMPSLSFIGKINNSEKYRYATILLMSAKTAEPNKV